MEEELIVLLLMNILYQYYYMLEPLILMDFLFVENIDEMALQGRTNDVHQACQLYLNCAWMEDHPGQFDEMVQHINELANEQPSTNSQPEFKLHSTSSP